ncbi:MAG: FAD-dependent oxidoreductase [Candidatus Marinimicrobia bacterium]|nr:FAD-dependent oxidoreductase [Candidatus Neomarinimicrobiota bacterium]|tara:strand:- start:1304 stop:2890 length:1587 start_codon:yes stop_codon:yes gene_type:complete
MKKWKTYNSQLVNGSYDSIVIGSGIGGLCTAALLSMQGQKVLVLEKHFKIGGWTHTFKRNNYEWDVGLHYIGQVNNTNSIVRRLFDLISESKLEWCPMDNNYDRIIFPDNAYDFRAPRTQFIDDMINYFPREESAILSYMKLMDDVVSSSRNYFSQKALSGLFDTVSYPFMTRKFFKYSDKTTLDVLNSLSQNKELIGVLTGQWGDYGLPPSRSSFAMHAMVARHYLDGASYPSGTSRRIAETISDVIEKNGGSLAVNAGVREIIVSNHRSVGVLMENGDKIDSRYVISGAGVVNTFTNMLGGNSAKEISVVQKMKTIQQTKSYVCLHLGLNQSATDLKIKNTNLWIYPGYDHDNAVEKYIQNPESEFPVVYVSFPSAKDDSWNEKHPNTATIEAITLSRMSWYDNWNSLKWKKRGDTYEYHKQELSNRILETVLKHVDGIENHIDYNELSTPLTVRDLANYPKGEMYGLDHSPDRFRQRWLRPNSGIKNLFFTGQDITTVGVSSALFSGLLTASTVLNKNLFGLLKK